VLANVDRTSIAPALEGRHAGQSLSLRRRPDHRRLARKANIPVHLVPAPGKPSPEAPDLHINNVNAYCGQAAPIPRRRNQEPAQLSGMEKSHRGMGRRSHPTTPDPRRHRNGTLPTATAIRATDPSPLDPPPPIMARRIGGEASVPLRRNLLLTDGDCTSQAIAMRESPNYGRPLSAGPMGRAGLGRRQAVRQRILIPPYGGSNPPAPANKTNNLGDSTAIGSDLATTRLPDGHGDRGRGASRPPRDVGKPVSSAFPKSLSHQSG
jgi:hypothetical protein